MDDDFNTGGAMGDVFELLRRLNKFIDDEKLEKKESQTPAKLAALRRGTTVLREMGSVLGLFRQPPAEKQPGGNNELVGKLMGLLIELRAESARRRILPRPTGSASGWPRSASCWKTGPAAQIGRRRSDAWRAE